MTRLTVERDGAIAIVRLSRPERRNAIDLAMWDEIAHAFGALDADPGVRCVLLGSVDPAAFSVGADLTEFREGRADTAGARAYEARMRPAIDALRGCRHPVVAALSGLCLGGGH